MNKVIKFGNICLLLSFGNNLYVQPQSISNEYSKETNLFEYGESLTSSEINFKNLFNNFPRFVKNANEIDLLSYEYVGVVKNQRQIRNFVKKNIYPNAQGWSVSVSYENHTGNSSQLPNIWLNTLEKIGSDKSELNKIIKTITKEYVQIGYEVYRIKFVCLLKSYEYYAFVDPGTKRVVTKGNIFGFSFPA